MIATILDIAVIAGLAAAGVGGWKLNQRLVAFRAIVPELRAEIEELNRSITKAEQVLAVLRAEATGRDSPDDEQRGPAKAATGGRRIRGLMDAMRAGAVG